MRKALLVNGHPGVQSLSSAAAARVKLALERSDCSVDELDASALPLAGHIIKEAYPDAFSEISRTLNDYAIIVCITPVWWYGPTAVMKNFIDCALQAKRQFVYTKKYRFLQPIPEGLMNRDTRVIVITTSGGPGSWYRWGLMPNYGWKILRDSFALCGVAKRNITNYHFGPAREGVEQTKIDRWLHELETLSF